MEEKYRTVSFPYGSEKIDICVPENKLVWVCSPVDVPGVTDVQRETQIALDNLIGCPDFRTLVRRGGKKTVLLIDDHTRITPQDKILPVLLNNLNKHGVSDDDITAIVALGTHRQMTADECRRKFGEEVTDRIEVINHIYNDPAKLVDLGTTKLGVPISVNRQFYEADLSIAVGNIIPHIYAGWSGGAKMVQPGVSGPKTTSATHMVAAPSFSEILGHVDNPVRREMEEVAKQCKLDLLINTVLNKYGEVVRIVAGDVVKAHRKGVEIAEEIYSFRFSVRPDVIIVSAYPAEADFWQASKAYAVASLMIKPGGTVILSSPCWEGVSPGHPTVPFYGQIPYKTVLEKAQAGEYEDEVGAAWYLTLSQARERFGRTIVHADGLTHEELGRFGFEKTGHLQSAIDDVIIKMNSEGKIGILTNGQDINPIRA